MELIAGVDEAGRGCLAGPVVAAAVVFLKNQTIEGLQDSKSLSAKKREQLFQIIKYFYPYDPLMDIYTPLNLPLLGGTIFF